jgi:hypothetical protein
MGIFFEPRIAVSRPELQDVIERALEARPPQDKDEFKAARDHLMHQAKKRTPGALKPASFLAAVGLLALFAALAWVAEKAQMPTATDSLWTAFQTVLGIILGFIGGEASGTASS